MIRAFQAFVLTLGGGAHGNWARAEFKVKPVQVFICQSQDYTKAPFVRLRSKCMMSDCSWSTGFSKDTLMYNKTWDDPKHLPLKPQLWPSDQTQSRAQNCHSLTRFASASIFILGGGIIQLLDDPIALSLEVWYPGLISDNQDKSLKPNQPISEPEHVELVCSFLRKLPQKFIDTQTSVTVSWYDCLWGSEAETPNLCVLKIKLQ